MDAAQVAALLVNSLMPVFLWSMNLGQGMSFTVQQIAAPFKQPLSILPALVLNSILIPLLYWGLSLILPMSSEHAIGLMLVGSASAAPFAIKAAVVEKGDVPLMIGLVVLLGALNILFIPLWSVLLMPPGTAVDALNIAQTLVLLILAPLVTGLLIRARWPEHAMRWAPPANRLSTLLLLLVVGLTVVASWRGIQALVGAWVIAGGVIGVLLSMIVGYSLGGRRLATRRTVATVSGMRAIGPALAIVASAFDGNTDIRAAVVMLGTLSFLPFAAAIVWGRRGKALDVPAQRRTVQT